MSTNQRLGAIIFKAMNQWFEIDSHLIHQWQIAGPSLHMYKELVVNKDNIIIMY